MLMSKNVWVRSLAWSAAMVMFLTACGGGGGGEADSGTDPAGTAPAGTATGNPPSSGATPPPTSSPPPAGGSDVTCGLAQFQSDLLQQVNAVRARGAVCGGVTYPPVSAVRWNDKLQAAVSAHSQDMASHNYFSHTSQDGRTPFQRMVAAGYTYSTASENIAAGQPTVSDVMASWLGSAGHCSNIMQAEAQDLAVACVRNPSSSYGLYWTMNLARPR